MKNGIVVKTVKNELLFYLNIIEKYMKNLVDFIKESKRRLGDYTKNELIKMGYHVQLDGKVFDKKGKYIGDMSNKDVFL